MIRAIIDQVSVEPGKEVRLASSTDAEVFDIQILRLLHGDPTEGGPGFQAESVACGIETRFKGVSRELLTGSYLRLPAPQATDSCTFCFWVSPTSPESPGQSLVSWGDESSAGRILLEISEQCILRLSWFTVEGLVGSIDFGRPIFSHRWHFVGIVFDTTLGQAALFQGRHGAEGPATQRAALGAGFRWPTGNIVIGARESAGVARQKFNGKISRPVLLVSSVDDFEVYFLQREHRPKDGGCWAEWDLSLEIGSSRVIDVSDHSRHGEAINAPARGVTGPGWIGPHGKTYESAPAEYDAIALHDDDLDEVDWPPFATPRILKDARSGIYAARLYTPAKEEVWLPFIVRPGNRQPAPVLFVVPTLTWQAYANRACVDEHEIGVSLYSPHRDGSPNYYSSWRKPHRSLDPAACFIPRGVRTGEVAPCCDLVRSSLYTIHWLEHLGIPYDVIADHDLHQAGDSWLHKRRVVLLTGHHEYWTGKMLDHVETWLNTGGRLMHLGGNCMYWSTSIDPQRPWLMEVRRFGGTGVGEADPGELQHSTTLAAGGTWRHAGRPSHPRVGIGFTATGFRDRGSPFARTPLSFDPRVRFVFEGVGDNEIIGDFGLNQGAAAGVEMDSADLSLGTPPSALVLASSFGHAPSFVLAKEYGIGRGPDPRVRADMVYLERPSGAQIFSVGSISWTGSLSHRNYHNNVARISNNVLRQFLGTSG